MKKMIIIEDCLHCPNWLKCEASKKLTPKQRFMLMTGVGIGQFILKECPLKDLKDVIQKIEVQ